jgi:hypothetical protein
MEKLSKEKRREAEKTLLYYKGRVYQSMGKHSQALKYFAGSLYSKRPFIFMKSAGFSALTVFQFLFKLTGFFKKKKADCGELDQLK